MEIQVPQAKILLERFQETAQDQARVYRLIYKASTLFLNIGTRLYKRTQVGYFFDYEGSSFEEHLSSD